MNQLNAPQPAAETVRHPVPGDEALRAPPTREQLIKAVLNYLASWSERDPARRLELVARTWTEDGSYVDHARHGRGHAAITEMIGVAQQPFPGYQLALAGAIECHHQYVRFAWFAGSAPDAPLALRGTDAVVLAPDGRFQSVIGFVDAPPTIIEPAMAGVG